MEKGIRSNMHYSFLDRQFNSFLWAAYMMQRSLQCLLFSGLWWEKTKNVQKYKLHCFLPLPSQQILVVITCSPEPFKWGTVAKSIRDVQICKEHLIAPWPDSTVQTSIDWSSVGMFYNKTESWPFGKSWYACLGLQPHCYPILTILLSISKDL